MMIELIKEVLLEHNEIKSWKITEKNNKSNELFFIKRELHMNRAKNVTAFTVTVYKDFEENGVSFRGSSTTKLHPTMDKEELSRSIEEAFFASGFIKNKPYPLALANPTTDFSTVPELKSKFSTAPLSQWMPILASSLYHLDDYENGGINSSEFFLTNGTTRIITSEGIDVSFSGYKGEIEFITNWKETGEEIELYKRVQFSDLDENTLKAEIKQLLTYSKEKATASPTPSLGKHTILLTGEPVKELCNYYYTQASCQAIYDGTSTAKINENIQGSNVKGDFITLNLDPFVSNSTESTPYDEDGFKLAPVTIFENGILKRYWGNVQFSHYLQVSPTGNIKNIVIEGGKSNLESFKEDPYLELVAFSDFQLNSLTGDFAGEIRLGWYYDGTTTKPVTGGSISGNIKELQEEMYLSKELQKDNSFIGPKTIKLLNVSVSGVE